MLNDQNIGRRISLVGSLTAILLLATLSCKSQAITPPIATLTKTPVPTLTATPLALPTDPPVIVAPTALPSEITDAKGVVMRLVPAGPFTMGSNAGMPDEQPVHTVELSAFYMDKYEVTNTLYKACVDASVCKVPANTGSGVHSGAYGTYGKQLFENYPVIWVDWERAKSYCEWRDARLPSEAEWEKAAHGTDNRIYPWGNTIDSTFANYGNNVPDNYEGVFGKTTAVGSYPKGQSPYGINDMAGNVWEWTADWYDVYPGGDSGANIAFGQKTYRVLRGGAWSDDPSLLRTTFRGGNTPDTTVNYIGFRCASTPSMPTQTSTAPMALPTPTSPPITSPVAIGKFARVYIQDGNLYYQNSESQQTLLTNTGKDRDPMLSDDGQKIVFFRAESIDKLYSINSDGSKEKVLITGKTASLIEEGMIQSPTFVPSKHLLLFNTYLCSPSKGMYVYPECVIGLYSVDTDTREINPVVENIKGNSQRDKNFDISPDGKYISVAGAGSINIYRQSSEGFKIAYPTVMTYYITSNSEYLPKQYWLPNSSGLIIIRAADGEGNDPVASPFFYDVFYYNLGEKQATKLQLDKFLMHDYRLDTWCISPDRSWILFSGNGTGDIIDSSLSNYLGNLKTGHTQGFENLSLDLESCRWSSDSKHFYVSTYNSNNIIGSTDRPPVTIDGTFIEWVDGTHYYYRMGEQTYTGEISGD